MNFENTYESGNIGAKIISILFHPLLMPLYGLLIIFTAPTLFWYIPLKVKMIIFFEILTNNVLIPISLLPFLKYRNIITSWNVEERKERIIPLLAVALLYSLSSYLISRFQIPLFIKGYIFTTALLIIIVFVVNFFWKISLYSAGAGAVTGIVVTLSIKMGVQLFMFLIPAVLISGIILTSRLKLNTHNSFQVYFGFFTGLIVLTLFMLFY